MPCSKVQFDERDDVLIVAPKVLMGYLRCYKDLNYIKVHIYIYIFFIDGIPPKSKMHIYRCVF